MRINMLPWAEESAVSRNANRMSPHRRHMTIAVLIAVILLMFAIVVARSI